MTSKQATLVGATGLVGRHILRLLLADKTYDAISVLTRREVNIQHPKLKQYVVDFSDEKSLKLAISSGSSIFCAVGTTRKKVKGDKEKYKQVDFDIPLRLARLGLQKNCQHFLLVSSVGANAQSNSFYLGLKGQIEDQLALLNFKSVQVFRPSLLIGHRHESRFGERIAQCLMLGFSWALPTRYKPTKAVNLAKAMIHITKQTTKGFHTYGNKAINLYSKD